ncbi:hypothetical protein [Streptomyces sp. NPDC006739]
MPHSLYSPTAKPLTSRNTEFRLEYEAEYQRAAMDQYADARLS